MDDRVALWTSRDTITWSAGGTVTLHYSSTAALKRNGGTVTGGTAITLSGSGGTYKIPSGELTKVPEILKSQVWVASSNGQVTGVQIQGVLDNLFQYNGALGPVIANGKPVPLVQPAAALGRPEKHGIQLQPIGLGQTGLQ